eukprot:jgi/Psemu1/291973/fgenesh1_pg.868_\
MYCYRDSDEFITFEPPGFDADVAEQSMHRDKYESPGCVLRRLNAIKNRVIREHDNNTNDSNNNNMDKTEFGFSSVFVPRMKFCSVELSDSETNDLYHDTSRKKRARWTSRGNQTLRGKLNDPRANDPRKGLAAAGASGTARLFWKINAESYGTVRRVGETEIETVPADHGEGGPRGPAVAAGIRGAGGRSGPVGSEQHAGRIAIAIAGSSDNNDNDNDSRSGS